MVLATNQSKMCKTCHRVFQIENFRLRRTTGTSRLNQCRLCHNLSERVRRKKKRQQELSRVLSKGLSRINDERNRDKVAIIVSCLLSKLGGVDAFVQAWHDYFETARNKGGYGTLRCLESVIRMMEYCDENEAKVEVLSEEELHESINQSLVSLLETYPEIAITTARKLGWQIAPMK